MRLRHLLLGGAGVLSLLLVVALLLRPEREVRDPFPRVGPAFSSQAPALERHDGYRKRTRYIDLADGTRLAADVFLPGKSGTADEPFPVVLQYTPYSYGRALALPHLTWWERIGFWWRTGRTEPILDQMLLSDLARYLVSRGFAFVAVDMRGTGASFGRHALGDRQLGRDGAHVVEWITRQPWSNGRVAMHGQSYVSWGQLATAAEQPEGLRCIVPEAMGLDLYTGLFRPGGILSENFAETLGGWFQGLNLNRVAPGADPVPIFPAAPVADEDGDGELVDEIPETGKGDPSTFLDDGTPSYRDGAERRRDLYYEATRQHLDNLPVHQIAGARFVDEPVDHLDRTVSFETANPNSFLGSILDSGVEMLVVGGWFDGPIRETVRLFAAVRPAMDARLLVGPRFHIPKGVTPAYREHLGYEGDLEAEIAAEKVRFFHRCLVEGGGRNAGEEVSGSGAAARVYVMHDGWRQLTSWPPPAARRHTLSVAEKGRLQWEPAVRERSRRVTDTLDVDFTHTATYGTTGSSRWFLMPPGGPDSLMVRTRKDTSALVWETAPLEEELTVVGHPIFEAWLSASRPAADLFVYLSDVGPGGQVVNVTEGQLRLNFHRPLRTPDRRSAEVEIRPALPEHGYRSSDYVDDPLGGRCAIEVQIDLLPTAWSFREGHRVRLSVAGADAGNFELHPGLCPEGTTASCAPMELYLHRGEGTLTQVRLPVVPAR